MPFVNHPIVSTKIMPKQRFNSLERLIREAQNPLDRDLGCALDADLERAIIGLQIGHICIESTHRDSFRSIASGLADCIAQ